MKRLLTSLALLAALAAVAIAGVGCGGSASGSSNKTPAGKGVQFTQSYGASGDQSRAVESGLGADVVAFSLEPDITRLVDEGLVDKSWNATPTKGMVTDSVVVLTVR